jgi:hypothetical protein
MEFLIFLFDLFLIITVVTGVVIILMALSTMFVSYCFAKSNVFEKSFLDKLNLIELSPKQTKLTNREIIDKMSNEMLVENVLSKISCENTWQMPILDELKENLKSEIADMKNTGGRNAGTSTAAWFLSNFTKSSSWLHLDIAGTAAPEKSNKETLSGPTGVMIRTLINYLLL